MLWSQYYEEVKRLNALALITNYCRQTKEPPKIQYPPEPFKTIEKVDSLDDIYHKLGKIRKK